MRSRRVPREKYERRVAKKMLRRIFVRAVGFSDYLRAEKPKKEEVILCILPRFFSFDLLFIIKAKSLKTLQL